MKRLNLKGFAAHFAAGAFLLTSLAAPAVGQDVDSLRQAMFVPLPPTIAVMSSVGGISPGSSSGSPTAFGPNFGDGFAGVGFQSRTRNLETGELFEHADGSVVAGFGLGNSRDLIGLEVSVTSFSTFNSGLLNRASLSFKAHKVFLGNTAIAVGWENAIHTEEFFAPKTLYGVVSRVWGQGGFNPFNTVTTSIGIGNGRFRFEDDILDDRERLNVFGSVGAQLTSRVSAIADWTGQDLALGASIVPFRTFPLVITPAMVDVTGTAGDGARFVLGAGVGFKFADAGRLFP